MTKTSNYQLNQWQATDRLSRKDFNRDNAAIDAAIKAVAETAAGKAGAAELAAVEQSVESKANAADVNALSQTVSALSETVNAHKIAVGSYTGNSGTQTINVGFTPKAVFVHSSYATAGNSHRSGFAITGKSFCGSAVVPDLVKITTNGFQVVHNENWSVNYDVYTYYYLAIA